MSAMVLLIIITKRYMKIAKEYLYFRFMIASSFLRIIYWSSLVLFFHCLPLRNYQQQWQKTKPYTVFITEQVSWCLLFLFFLFFYMITKWALSPNFQIKPITTNVDWLMNFDKISPYTSILNISLLIWFWINS